jgi:hypothetical protein
MKDDDGDKISPTDVFHHIIYVWRPEETKVHSIK